MTPAPSKEKLISVCKLTGWLSRKKAGEVAETLPSEGIVFLRKRYKNGYKKRTLYTVALRVSRVHKGAGKVVRVRMKSIFSSLPQVQKIRRS